MTLKGAQSVCHQLYIYVAVEDRELKEALSRCCKFSSKLLQEMAKVRLRTRGHAPAGVFQVEGQDKGMDCVAHTWVHSEPWGGYVRHFRDFIHETRKIAFLQSSTSLMSIGFPGGSDSKESACTAGDLSSISGSGRFPGEGNGNPLQYSCLENFMHRGACQVQSTGSQRVRHNLATNTFTNEYTQYQSASRCLTLLLVSYLCWMLGIHR